MRLRCEACSDEWEHIATGHAGTPPRLCKTCRAKRVRIPKERRKGRNVVQFLGEDKAELLEVLHYVDLRVAHEVAVHALQQGKPQEALAALEAVPARAR